jgi:hypothetical protein
MASTIKNPELLRLTLRCDRSAPALARDAVRELEANGAVPQDAVLLVSELVSSEVLGRGFADDETIELVATSVIDGIRLSVDTGTQGQLNGPGPLGGRVVRGISQRWGIASLDGTPELWAELAA